MVRGESGQPGGGQQLSAVFRGQVREQDLAARSGVQRCELSLPVVRGDRGRAAHLVDVDGEMRTPTAMFTVSPTPRPAVRQTGRACWVTSRRPGTPLASRTTPKPSRYLPRSWVCSTSSRSSSAASNRNAVDLCTPISAATSLTPVLTPLGQDFQHAHSAVDRLDTAGSSHLARCS